MSWSSRRKTIFILIVSAVFLTIVALTLVATLYEAPSCADGKQNQDERGIDCGGSCKFLCIADVREPSVRFVRYLTNTPGRIDAIAYIDNPNPREAVRDARFTVTIYDANGEIGKQEGIADLPPAMTVPVFFPGVARTSAVPIRAFLSFDGSSLKWFRMVPEATPLAVLDTRITEAEDGSRITARVRNMGVTDYYDVDIIATVFDAENNAIAASASVVDVPAGGETPLVFTWSTPFVVPPARAEILPFITLPISAGRE
ncbi:MAG: hypothetical protein KBC38_01695 [Candidatus Pacebacteria bacterium]|nr:hypothetical protein [Candidatus Paceibacterota bacterium]MBP9840754.1 hypothetical protein [Candidatus Paceibacterota bacterium]